jgi:uncharacterized lipoprotein YmbA
MKIAVLPAFLLAAAIAGCGTSPRPTFYLLDADTALKHTGAKVTYTIAVGPVSVPDGLDRPQIVTRARFSQVAINEFERWAEPLRSQIGRVIAANLSQLLNGAYVYAYPQGAGLNADYTVYVNVQRFDSALGEAAAIDVQWTVRPSQGAARNGRSQVREPSDGKSYDALVAAHNRALAEVSRQISDAFALPK